MMQRVFLVHHMKRSGGHAVINWLLESEKGSVFFNNDIPIQPILTGQASLPDGSASLEDWARHKPPVAQRAIARAPALFVSLEDHGPEVKPFQHPDTILVVILREPESLFASRIRKASTSSLKAYDYNDSTTLDRAIRLWKEHARLVLGLAPLPSPYIGVLYDAWLVSDPYRDALAREFGLSAPRPPSLKMTSEGGGSSFADETIDPSSLRHRADLLDEAEKKVLRRIMADPEMLELANLTTAAVGEYASSK
jgi:hypothetical protein